MSKLMKVSSLLLSILINFTFAEELKLKDLTPDTKVDPSKHTKEPTAAPGKGSFSWKLPADGKPIWDLHHNGRSTMQEYWKAVQGRK